MENSTILQTLEQLKEASLEALRAALPAEINKRTLQRRLAKLIAIKQVIIIGAGPTRRYQPAHSSLQTTETPDAYTYFKNQLPARCLSQLKSVSRPLVERTPVGYQPELLDTYLPNETFYLNESTRNELAEIGRVSFHTEAAGTYARQIFERLLIDLSWNSSRLEGNTYSLLETQRLLQMGEQAPHTSPEDTQMILNHKAAIEFLVQASDEIGFNPYTILNLHALLADGLLGDPAASGNLRSLPIAIGRTVYHPLEIPALIEEKFRAILKKASAIQDPFEQAFFCMVHLPYLQPFIDVNKRVSRLSANIPLIKQNLCPLSFVNVPKKAYIDGIIAVYELNQTQLLCEVFIFAYKQSCARYNALQQSLGKPDPFRLQHRALIYDTIHTIVSKCYSTTDTVTFLKQTAQAQLPKAMQAKFIELVETELLSLHTGNTARFSIKPSEFETWKTQT